MRGRTWRWSAPATPQSRLSSRSRTRCGPQMIPLPGLQAGICPQPYYPHWPAGQPAGWQALQGGPARGEVNAYAKLSLGACGAQSSRTSASFCWVWTHGSILRAVQHLPHMQLQGEMEHPSTFKHLHALRGRLAAAQTTHEKQMELYLTSKFCLMLPGDSQTSRRLPEAVMAGCVPVFLGPPFHSMPLANQARSRPDPETL